MRVRAAAPGERLLARQWRAGLAGAWLALLALVGPVPARGDASLGLPLIQRYTAEDVKAAPTFLSTTTDNAGRLYAANSDGVLHFDGERWRLVVLPNDAIAREVSLGADGRIYVAAEQTFGVLEHMPSGEIAYRELLTAAGLAGADRNVGSVWEAVPTSKGVYFRTPSMVYYLGYDGRAQRWPMPETSRTLRRVGDDLYMRVAGTGLCRLVDGELVPVPGAETFTDQPFLGIFQREGWRLVVGGRGIYRSDAEGIRPVEGDGALLGDVDANVSLSLPDESVVVGTRSGELLHFDRDMRLQGRFAPSEFNVVGLGLDRDGGLWVASDGVLVRLVLPSPWSYIGRDNGVPGVRTAEWHDGKLWLATSRGAIRMQPDASGRAGAVFTGWSDGETLDLVSTEFGLLVGDRFGVSVLDPSKQQPRLLYAEQEGVAEIVRSRFDGGLAYAVGYDHLFLLRERDGLWQQGAALPLDGMSDAWLVETARNEFWTGDEFGAPKRWRIDPDTGTLTSREAFGSAQGLPQAEQRGSYTYSLDGQLRVNVGAQAYAFDGTSFHPVNELPASLLRDRRDLRVTDTRLGVFANNRTEIWHRPRGATAWKQLFPGSPLATGFRESFLGSDGIVRIATYGGVLQFDPGVAPPEPAPLVAGLAMASHTDPEGVVRPLPLASASPHEIAPDGRLRFEPSTVSLGYEVAFRHRVSREGDSAAAPWSDWGGRDIALTTETPGAYSLTLEARTDDGRTAPPLTYRYRVLPHWYQTPLVRFSAFVALALLVYVVARALAHLRTRRLLEANLRLEARVAERTHQLAEANQVLEETNADLVASREQVVESGKRADLIFKALNDALVGTVLNDHYRIEGRIGSGGFGTVYRATETHLGNPVAVKVFKPVPGHDAQRSMERFRAEGRSAFKVNHPNAVRVLDFGIALEAVAFLVMEYIDGDSLADRLAASRLRGPAEAVSILQQVAAVLAHAHSVGVVHRDIKPNNILICVENGREVVKLIDFGIAKVLDQVTPTDMRNLTATGLLMGTPNYMAPERFVQAPYDGKSDVYALGVVAYEMLAGRRPFADAGEDYLPVALQHINESPPPLPAAGLPARLVDFVMHMLAKNPDDRPTAAEAAAFLAGLEELGGFDPTPEPATPAPPSTTPATFVFATPNGSSVAD